MIYKTSCVTSQLPDGHQNKCSEPWDVSPMVLELNDSGLWDLWDHGFSQWGRSPIAIKIINYPIYNLVKLTLIILG